MSTATWFEVDKEGLAKLLVKRGKGFVVNELIQNAWDTRATKVVVTLKAEPGRPLATLVVDDDDPDGFQDLRHAFTLFAESEKKGDPEKRGRFNLGEKLVIAVCEEASIMTTKGSVRFDREGRHALRARTAHGSIFTATLRMTREELDEVNAAVRRLIPPNGVQTIFNGTPLPGRVPIAHVYCILPTEISDAEGFLRRSERQTVVEIHETLEGEEASVYEMGIPVVPTGDRWSYNVMQKVPLNSDRDNVTPAYLARLRTAVLNETHRFISKEDATEEWVREASGNEDASKAAVEKVITLRFGDRRVIADPSDPEGTKRAVSEGYTVIQPGSLSASEWKNVKRDTVALPAGQVTPSAKPYSANGDPLKLRPESSWTDGMKRVAAYAQDLASELLGRAITVRIASEFTWHYNATYGPGELTFNLGKLGHDWFNQGPREEVDRLLLHELAHERESDHLSDGFHRAICALGAKLATLALRNPEFFKRHGR